MLYRNYKLLDHEELYKGVDHYYVEKRNWNFYLPLGIVFYLAHSKYATTGTVSITGTVQF